MEREVGGGIGMGNTCKPMAVLFQCMTKFTTNKKKKKKVAGVTLWIHHTGLKRAYHADLESDEWTAQEDPTDLIPMNPRSP